MIKFFATHKFFLTKIKSLLPRLESHIAWDYCNMTLAPERSRVG